jgi:N-acetyl-anhydromuramyl-L-alanine amidase AmpD
MPVTCYNNESTKKTQIVIHHTAGSYRPDFSIHGWVTENNRVGAHFCIGGLASNGDKSFDGKIYQAVPQAKYVYHLGIKGAENDHELHDKSSIGIELCNWGALTKTATGEYINYVHQQVPASQVVDLGAPFRGSRYYHAYTDAQLQALAVLIPALVKSNGIVLEKGRKFTVADFAKDIPTFSKKAVAFHVNYRLDKWDCSCQPKLIQLLDQLHA